MNNQGVVSQGRGRLGSNTLLEPITALDEEELANQLRQKYYSAAGASLDSIRAPTSVLNGI